MTVGIGETWLDCCGVATGGRVYFRVLYRHDEESGIERRTAESHGRKRKWELRGEGKTEAFGEFDR